MHTNTPPGPMANRKPVPEPLVLANTGALGGVGGGGGNVQSSTPSTAKSPTTPRSPFRPFTSQKQGDESTPESDGQQQQQRPMTSSQTVPTLTTNQSVAGRTSQDRQERPTKPGFFSSYKATKTANRFGPSETIRAVDDGNMSRDAERPTVTTKPSSQETKKDAASDRALNRRPVATASKSEASLPSPTESGISHSSAAGKKNKPSPFSILTRSKSLRSEKEELSPREPLTKIPEPERERANTQPSARAPPEEPAAEIKMEKGHRARMGSNARQPSQDRIPTTTLPTKREAPPAREPSKLQPAFQGASSGGGHTFFSNAKSFASKGAGVLSKGFFGRGERRDSTAKKEPAVDDEHYVLKVLNQPLVTQTRKTRISKRLEDSRDKTEFWMPAFPWRAIDYLNYKGSDVEGLYRVPGSGPQIKKWQRRFDEELDIDLFAQDDLYDINIIGSMLKAWMRELPDELFPKASQIRIARECQGATEVPQLLIDELSNLSPFNYYLLFAITCHLSLLLTHSEKNKMDFRNLCICFQPCMRIDAFCFNFLVNHWRDCWKGCKNELAYTEAEYQMIEPGPPSTAEGRSSVAVESHDERNVSSSDSSKPSSVSLDPLGSAAPPNRADKKTLPLSQGVGSMDSGEILVTTLTINQDKTPPRHNADMRPLSPIQPLSPLHF
ncbi:RhoGAP domain-containing protein [Phlyctema vagabunda]|uniref:RhoGAP domain-containing protein n=1 Tax=Phlyctema vagabunda TaxID=108571 RepID=A0ABR4P3S1_9HELO